MKTKSNRINLDEAYKDLELHAGRINFLRDAVNQLNNDGFISAGIEVDFLEHGFTEILDKIKAATKDTILKILNEQITLEEKELRKINKEIENANQT